MAPVVTRELSITYGSTTVGGTTDRYLDGYTHVTRGYETASVEFSFIVTQATEALFAAECLAIEAAFRTPYLALTVTQGSSTLLSLSHSGSTGFDAQPEIVKAEDIADTGRTRRYTVRITFGCPADGSGMDGRRESRVDVSYSPSRRRTVTMTGTWTAIGGTTAHEKYEAKVDTWADAVLTALTGTYDLAEESFEFSTNDKTADFRRVYEEIIRSQGGASVDDTAIVRQSLVISRRQSAPGDYDQPPVNRVIVMDVRYSAHIDKTVTTDLPGKWASIRGWVVEQVRTVLSGGALAVIAEAPEYDGDENRISATMTCEGVGSGDVLESTLSVEDSDDLGQIFTPVWSGDPFACYLFQGPRVLLRTIHWTLLCYGTLPLARARDYARMAEARYSEPPMADPGGKARWIGVSRSSGIAPRRRGIEPDSYDTTEISVTVIRRWRSLPEGGGETSPPPTPLPGGGGTTTPV